MATGWAASSAPNCLLLSCGQCSCNRAGDHAAAPVHPASWITCLPPRTPLPPSAAWRAGPEIMALTVHRSTCATWAKESQLALGNGGSLPFPFTGAVVGGAAGRRLILCRQQGGRMRLDGRDQAYSGHSMVPTPTLPPALLHPVVAVLALATGRGTGGGT